MCVCLQKIFQAQKKLTGNTFTARGMPLNIAAAVFIIGGGALVIFNGARKMYYGVGKVGQ